MTRKVNAYVNGSFIEPSTDRVVNIVDPVTNEVFAVAPALSREQITATYIEARKAFNSWKFVDFEKKVEILSKWADIMERDVESFTNDLSQEVAKNLSDSKKEVLRTVDYIRETIEVARDIDSNPLRFTQFAGKDATFKRVPRGVILAISPFNYPLNLAVAKIIPALLMGNTMVFKAATQGNVTGANIANSLHEAGIPAGVFNYVTGKGSEIGDFLAEDPNVDMIMFTGGTEVGTKLSKTSQLIPVELELGGKDPAIVLDDVDVAKVAKEIVMGAFSYSGQRCTAIKRVFVSNNIGDELVSCMKEEIAKLSIGTPKEDAFITPVIDRWTADFIMGLNADAIEKGATLVCGNKQEGNLLHPTLIDNVTKDMRLAWEEPFGPTLPIIRVDSVDEAIELSNDSEFGLQGAIFTNDIEKAWEIAEKLDTGTVNFNGSSSRGPDAFPFLGVKGSGQGVQGITQSIESVTRFKGFVNNIK